MTIKSILLPFMGVPSDVTIGRTAFLIARMFEAQIDVMLARGSTNRRSAPTWPSPRSAS